MKRILKITILLSLILSACQGLSIPQAAPSQPAASATLVPASPTNTPEPQPSNTPAASATPQPTATQTASPTPSPVPREQTLRAALLAVVASEYWPLEGLSPERSAGWEAFVNGLDMPGEAELDKIDAFLELWDKDYALIQAGVNPADAQPALKAREFEDGDGQTRPVPYAIDLATSQAGRSERLFLIVYDRAGKRTGLTLAPEIEGLRQHISSDGLMVEYFNDKGEWLVKANGRKLNESSNREATFKKILDENNFQTFSWKNSIYPRYIINIPEINSGFYAIETLTYNQILLLMSTLELYNRESLSSMKPEVFASGNDVEYIITREPHPFAAAMALPLGGTPRQGIIILYTRNLFNNKYDTAASIAHEATHIWQGQSPGCDNMENRLRRETGDGTIPANFYYWSAEELVSAAKTGKIGAYHVSLWVLNHFNQAKIVSWMEDLIRTSRSNIKLLTNCLD
ncbi:MAG: PT domain-containing protein [Chloroflexota bacterium]